MTSISGEKRRYRKGGRTNREEYNAYMRHYVREKYHNNEEFRLKEMARNKLRYHKLKEEQLANLATYSKTI
jgi:hypothetical protein